MIRDFISELNMRLTNILYNLSPIKIDRINESWQQIACKVLNIQNSHKSLFSSIEPQTLKCTTLFHIN